MTETRTTYTAIGAIDGNDDDMTWTTEDGALNLAAVANRITQLERMAERQNSLIYTLQAEIVTLRKRLDDMEADS